MNYDEQRLFLLGSRIVTVILASPLFVLAVFLVLIPFARADEIQLSAKPFIGAAILLALTCSIIYTPNYLHLSVTANKPTRWQVRIRWRIAAVVALLSLMLAQSWRERVVGLAAAMIIAAVNLVGKRLVDRSWLPELYFLSDALLFCGCYFAAGWAYTSLAIPAAVSFHLWAAMGSWHRWCASAVALLLLITASVKPDLEFDTVFLVVTVLATVVAVSMAAGRGAKNRTAGLSELRSYTGRSAEDVVRMWQTSNQQLAANWEAAKLKDDDHQALKQWYADNSELYMFAISAYNLEYRRIKSNLFVLQYGRGHALDYGAGNGELVLEMARRGQRAAYYDVDGATLRFAKWRAQQRGLDVEFFTDKESLAATRPFDTVFSFDVLEHIPNLAAELEFLSSLLGPGGQMVFDLPTGATKAHPMHLEHRLDFRKFLNDRSLREKKRLVDYIPFRKQEKFVFVK